MIVPFSSSSIRTKLSIAFGTALALIVAWENRAYPVGSLTDPGPGYLPLALAIFLGVTGLLIALAGGGSPRFTQTRWPELTRAVVILVACGFAAIALERLGYRLTMFALLVFFLGVVERKKPVVVAAVRLLPAEGAVASAVEVAADSVVAAVVDGAPTLH